MKYQNIKCKICYHDTSIWGCVDSNKSCEENNGFYLPYTGNAIYYLKCNHCSYLFTVDYDHWSIEDYKNNIYNDDYIKVDPEYANGARSFGQAQLIMNNQTFPKHQNVLDYGAGNGLLGSILNENGYNVESWDPMWGKAPSWHEGKKFDFIMAFEVMEHTPTPTETIREMKQWLKPNGSMIIGTLSNDIMEGKRDINHWYLSPRNGHVCMYSNRSLDELFSQIGMTVTHYPWNIHIANS